MLPSALAVHRGRARRNSSRGRHRGDGGAISRRLFTAPCARNCSPAFMSSPDLSALRIDERARRSPRRFGWRAIAVVLIVVLAGAAGLFVALREKAPEVEVATVRADKGGRAALLNASGYVTP